MITGMITRALDNVVTHLSSNIDAFGENIMVCECGQGAIEEVTTQKATIGELRRDVDQQKSTDM